MDELQQLLLMIDYARLCDYVGLQPEIITNVK